MAGKLGHHRAAHEAGHAVIARKLGLPVTHVDARSGSPEVQHASAAYRAKDLNAAERIAAYEGDAKVALAGRAVNRRERPSLHVFDLLANDDADTTNAASAIYKIICLKTGWPLPQRDMRVSFDEGTVKMMDQEYLRLVQETATLVDQHWPAIERVAKHLERHGRIDTQAELDDLIERAERRPRAL